MKKLLFISLTNKCNRNCSYCPIKEYVNNPEYPDNLPLKELYTFIIKANPDYIELTGGEPTLYKDYNILCDKLEELGITYLTKSNGDFPGRNQVSAWHTDFPKYYNKILIIKHDNWQEKINHCKEFNIPHGLIGYNEERVQCGKNLEVETMFICPDGRIKQCHEHEILKICNHDYPLGIFYSEQDKYTIHNEPRWNMECNNCKSINDYFTFIN